MSAKRKEHDKDELDPIGLHELRHCGRLDLHRRGREREGPKYVSRPLLDPDHPRPLGHLMPGSESEAVQLVDAHLERSNTQAG